MARAGAIVEQSRAAGLARTAVSVVETALARSRARTIGERVAQPLRDDARGGRTVRVLVLATGAAAVHAALATALPPIVAPAVPITAVLLAAAVVAVFGR